MAAERLTQKALEQHDKVHPKLLSSKERTHSCSRDELSNSLKGRSRIFSRTDSMRSIPNLDGTASSVDRQNSSRHSLMTPRPRAGLSVFRIVAAARAWKRMSQRKPEIPVKPEITMENTFRLGPHPEETFKSEKVQVVLGDVLGRYLRHFKYTPDDSKQMCLAISSEIKSRVKGLGFPRYKIVSQVIIFQNKGQGSEVCSRCIWSQGTDSFASDTFKNGQFVCVANVHAVYCE
ncbi:unnamed protein product [Lymnaea stagnalis]|uniref:Uncharacterized protein n=1 Tax=Lymnaea stagnalis TaxID=6523 RepID=A0AAV2HSW3_LYMST